MDRITDTQLAAVVERLNRATNSPVASWTKTPTGNKANLGNYHLDYAYGYVSLNRMMNDGGGVERILPGGTKRELYHQLHAFLAGVAATKKGA